ncbi:MAG: S8 family peptidase, partial [Chloroflexota bacterium]
AIAAGAAGFYLDIALDDTRLDAIDKLANRPAGVELVNVQRPLGGAPDARVMATVFVPQQVEEYFQRKVRQYRDEVGKGGNPRHEALVTRIDNVRLATVRSLFTDLPALFPPRGETIWWEVWLRQDQTQAFRTVASQVGIEVNTTTLSFPERQVVLAFADESRLEELLIHSAAVAELRLPKDAPSAILSLTPVDQQAMIQRYLARVAPPAAGAPAVCILDSGVTQAHPLIQIGLDPTDLHTNDPTWGTGDTMATNGHGTAMAGVVLHGDLVEALATPTPFTLQHRLESVRVLPPNGFNPASPELFGAKTEEAVARVEAHAPDRRRAVCMAITGQPSQRGQPSSWSAAIDQLCADPESQRLFLLNAGNLDGDLTRAQYINRNDVEQIGNPAQAWNALTVGAYTEKVVMIDPNFSGYTPFASAGNLSPSSRTSVSWTGTPWPNKPDVVFEGGNLTAVGDADPGQDAEDLRLLTTFYLPGNALFRTFGDTSGATALAAKMAGELMATYPHLRPETVRGLIVHSAEWTDAMRGYVGPGNAASLNTVLRRYGYGVPDFGRAARSARNDATMVIQSALQPFTKQASVVKTNEMHLHSLPWPREELRALGDTPAELRVTLSYFIEPSPGGRGWTRRYRYASHLLRFEVKTQLETHEEFRRRINKAVWDDDETGGGPTIDSQWRLRRSRDRGSIHSDVWRGLAVELAEREAVAVYPLTGWWKERPHLQRWGQSARYALIVSLRVPTADIDIYTSISTQIAAEIPIAVAT